MRTLGLHSRFFAIGTALSVLFALLTWGFQRAPEAARAALAQDVARLRSHSTAPNIAVFNCDLEVQRPKLPPREKFTPPIFPGCEDEADYEKRVFCGFRRLASFIEDNRNDPQGSAKEVVMVGFKIDGQTGLMSDLYIKRARDERNSREALRVMNLLVEREVRWTPPTRDGESFDANLLIPVGFHGARCGD